MSLPERSWQGPDCRTGQSRDRGRRTVPKESAQRHFASRTTDTGRSGRRRLPLAGPPPSRLADLHSPPPRPAPRRLLGPEASGRPTAALSYPSVTLTSVLTSKLTHQFG